MCSSPVSAVNLGLSDLLVVLTFDQHGNREPLNALGRFDLVSIAPIAARVLHFVVEDEFINGCDKVEVAFPGDVVGLDDCHSFHFFSWSLKSSALRNSLGRTNIGPFPTKFQIRGCTGLKLLEIIC